MISEFGRVWNCIDNKFLATSKDNNGYVHVHLMTINGFRSLYVHRLVKIEFDGFDPDPNKTQVDHIDGIKDHNYLLNLDWVTPFENTHRALHNNLCPHINNIIDEDDVKFICEQLCLSKSCREISDMLYSKTNTDLYFVIRDIYKGNKWVAISKNYMPFPESLDKQYSINKRNIQKNSILTESLIHEICKRLENGERSIDIANDMKIKYNLSKSIEDVIGGIRQGKNYKRISSQYNIIKGSSCRKEEKI